MNETTPSVLYGDSVTGDSKIIVDDGEEVSIESLFGDIVFRNGDREYAHTDAYALTYNIDTRRSEYRRINYVMRHHTVKNLYRVWTPDSNWLDVTEDHSLMGYADAAYRRLHDTGPVVEIKPQDVGKPLGVKQLIQVNRNPSWNQQTDVSELGPDVILRIPTRIEKLGPVAGYVYDIEVDGTHTFFANHILVHNTDSAYCDIQSYMVRNGIENTDDNAVAVADGLEKILFKEIPILLGAKFVSPPSNLEMLEAGREGVFAGGIFKNAKKRYALHQIDDEGKRFREDESGEGKMKIMGMETKRSDTPVFVQDFLMELLKRVIIRHQGFDEINEYVKEFKEEYHLRSLWENGSPSRVSNVAANTKVIKSHLDTISGGGISKMPYVYHVTKACIFTNLLIDANGENRWSHIEDGDKVQTLKLYKKVDGFNSVAIKTDEDYIPEWFKQLPFDGAAMEETLDKKVYNVIGVTGWDFSPPKTFAADIVTTMDDWYE